MTSSSTSNGPDDNQPTNGGNNGPISSNKLMLNALSHHQLSGLSSVGSLNGSSNHQSLTANGQLINGGQGFGGGR